MKWPFLFAALAMFSSAFAATGSSLKNDTCSLLLLPESHRKPIAAFPKSDVKYVQTDREHLWLTDIYPAEWLDPRKLRGLRVLDVGCGPKGVLVKTLRENGVEAYGLDLSLAPELKTSPLFFEADMRATPFLMGQFDVVFATASLFTTIYEGNNEAVVRNALLELKRITVPGGVIRIGFRVSPTVSEVVRTIPGLFVTAKGEIKDDYIQVTRRW